MDIQNFPKVTVILRGYTYPQIRAVVKNLVGSRLRSVEITMNTPGALEAIEKISQEFQESILVGAGTVLTYEEAQASIAAGAAFLLSPTMLDKKILDLCREKKIISVPGAFSPTEIKKSFEDGADIVKVFPAARLGSRYLSDLAAPLGKMPLMVVGGIGTGNIEEYFKAGASFAGIASGIFEREDILNQNEEGIRKSIEAMENKLKELEGE
ncbi:2-dehydro-3-deoxyphosphogluconate aldolase [Clostridiaceae bacterium]|nr:bifunctional 4-hydroxy-2-oxoglutarate aldolase/2-dehydro-3-deoxy-phosphogluconate aldolase [Lachnospiraceae bacterium]NBH18075.1 2-dehydro-3-deoxyphosphogluconate aldolase [Clostridiaceae bacterium]NBH34203.1 2-dehydro-3-deoxyphosphogluconate aldolase [Clostridiaceae bacterium]